MNNQPTWIFILVLFIIIPISHAHSSLRLLNHNYNTTLKFCSRFNNTNLVADQESAEYKNAMGAYWKVSGNDLFASVFQSNDRISTGISHAHEMIIPIIFFIGPFLIGFLILILIWPFLLCCCFCPRHCPPRYLRKPDFQPYQKCQLAWPSAVLITALLLVVFASLLGIAKSSDIQNTFYAVGCSISLTLDDTINGNESSGGVKFTGLRSLVEGMKILKAQLSNLETDMNNLVATGSALDLAYTEGETILDKISKIPNGTSDSYLPNFSYNRFSDGNSTNPITSIIPNILGKASILGPNQGIVGNMYNTMKNVHEQIVKKIKNQTQTFINSVNSVSSPLSLILNSIIDQVSSLQTTVEPSDEQTIFMNDRVSSIFTIVTTVMTVIFGIFIALGMLGVIGTISMTFCKKFKCRYFLYFICLIFVFVGIICFIMTVIFSIVTPTLYLFCDFLSTSVSSQSNFQQNLGTIFGYETSNKIKVCLPGSSGKILDEFGLDLTGIISINNTVSEIRKFNLTEIQNQIENSFNETTNQIEKYYFSHTLDFTNEINQNFMKKIANPTLNYPGCTFGNDQWIPGLGQTSITCGNAALSIGNASIAQCPSSTEIGSTAYPACQGCLDTTKIIYNVNSVSDLKNRYGSCSSWSNDIQAIWDNYYSIKKNNVETAMTRLDAVVNSQYNSKLANVKTDFDTVITNLQVNLDSVFNENNGILTGLNCQILGEDINLIVSTTCNSLFNTFYFLRIILAIVSFCILFSICCITCSGIRVYKHSEKMKQIEPDDQQIKMDMIINQQTGFSLGQKQ